MKISVQKDAGGGIIAKIIEGTTAKDFDYVLMIKEMYDKKEVELNFDKSITVEDQALINKLFKEIGNVFVSNEKGQTKEVK